ncbi:MAG TPA: nodulation protein NfeD, partial [bacterium]|nr:nodulation protein NfeD [bacterium]
MRYLRSILIPTALLLAAAPAPAAAVEEAPVLKIVINGDINPVSAMFIVQSIHAAEKLGCTCLIVQMDTPGGLLESTKTIVKEILAAKVPVVMYVAPSGSGAVSAGVFITLAC